MKNKKKLYIILGIVLFLIVVATLLYFLVFKKDKKKGSKPIECDNITGGSYNLVFKSTGETLSTMSVCIACAPNSYEDLLEPTKEGYVFEGWFYDESLENAVVASSSIDITPVAKKDKNDCVIGYEDITLYAKWAKEGNKSINISFDANGGNKVNDVVIKCDENDTATITKLPISKRDGYSFIAWKDSYETPILEGAKLTCDSDLKLKASWEKLESNNPILEEKKYTYKCEDGWKLDGTNCTKASTTDKVKGTYTCKSDETLIGKMCVKIKGVPDEERKSYTITTCNKASIYAGHGGPREYDGVLFPDGVTCFYKEENYSKEECINKDFKWNSNNNKCYNETRTGNTTVTCKSDDYYYVAKPNDYEGINGMNSGCYPKRAADETCPSGYTVIPSKGGTLYCGKIETKAAIKVEE